MDVVRVPALQDMLRILTESQSNLCVESGDDRELIRPAVVVVANGDNWGLRCKEPSSSRSDYYTPLYASMSTPELLYRGLPYEYASLVPFRIATLG